jgi:putative flavoprotein involved in K+ transport
MNTSVLDVIVIGAGHAGLSVSYQLKKLHLAHIVFEKGKIGDTWRNQRWDSFRFNTTNRVNLLPGQANIFSEAEGFCSAPEFVDSLDGYARTFQLPVVENCKVLSVEKIPDLNEFQVAVSENGSAKYYRSKQIVVASGGQNIKNIPLFAGNISPEILQLHTSEYRNSSLLPEGSILVIGSAQSGVQVAEDLIDNGREVFISTSRVTRVPRRYRGSDIVDWLILTGFYDTQTNDVSDSQILEMKFPQISGTGLRGHTLSLQSLAQKGVVVLGKTGNADGDTVYIQPDVVEHVNFADESSGKVKDMIDLYIRKSGLYVPPNEKDTADIPDRAATCASTVTSLNIRENDITSIIWSTGYSGDFSYLKLPVFNEFGMLKYQNGISDIEGLYFLGLPWLRKRKSGIILGIREDSEFVAEKILASLIEATTDYE